MTLKAVEKTEVDKLFREAQSELDKETKKEAMQRIKKLLVDRGKAVKLLANLDREILSLKADLAEELS